MSDSLVLLLTLSPVALIWILFPSLTDVLLITYKRDVIIKNHNRNFLVWMMTLTLIVHGITVFREVLCDWQCIDWGEYGQVWLASIFIFVLIYVPFTLYGKYAYYKSLVKGEISTSDTEFKFKGEGNDSLQIDLDRVVFMKVDDNYVDIAVITSDGPKKTTLRVTLKSLQKQLGGREQFIKTHRGYIINLKYFAGKLRANSICLFYGDDEIDIPVSRKHRSELVRIIG